MANETKQHRELRLKASTWLAEVLKVPEAIVRTDAKIGGHKVDVCCSAPPGHTYYPLKCVVECGNTNSGKLKLIHDAGCVVFLWKNAYDKPKLWEPDYEF